MGVKPLIIGTRNATNFLPLGIKVLREGGSAMDAVEATVNGVEDNPLDSTVGYGGFPNLLGYVELDASIMDGRTLRAGAVAAVKHFKNPISIARKVMEETPHLLLVGDGAEIFADAMGFQRCELLTPETRQRYEDTIKELTQDLGGTSPTALRYPGRARWYEKLSKEHHGTVNVIAIDSKGDICTGVSTSGLGLKLPGRVGDSPIIGAGNYADNRFGGAGCTGTGELTIRLSSARTIVANMRYGMGVAEACLQAMREVNALEGTGGVSCIAMDNRGNTYAASNRGLARYGYMDIDSEAPKELMGGLV
jgi:beta-aspartyl-peptidase (threonine type)